MKPAQISVPPGDAPYISALHVYPIKGCNHAALRTWKYSLNEWGMPDDRRWMVVRLEPGLFYTQRELPQMAQIEAAVLQNEGPPYLFVRAPGMPNLTVNILADKALTRRLATVWSFTGEALDEGDEAATWFSEFLRVPCRLVRAPQDFTRRVSPWYGKREDRVAFADGYPILLTSEESLTDLNRRLQERGQESVPMSRFRPNIVVSRLPAWSEDTIAGLRVPSSGISFQAAKPCARCAVITIDQKEGIKTGPEPLATLSTFRKSETGKVNFGIYLLLNPIQFQVDSATAPLLNTGDLLEIEVR